MPEQQNHERERLAGETTVTPSSDAAITSRVEELIRGIRGLSADDVVVEGETLSPITQLVRDEEKDLRGQPTNVLRIAPKPDHRSSRLGLSILQRRVQKKAA